MPDLFKKSTSKRSSVAQRAALPQAVPTAPGRLPVIGHMWPLTRNPFNFFESLRDSGEIVKFYIGSRPIYYLTTARLAHEVLVTEARAYGKGIVYEAVHPLSGNGLLASGRELHRRQRRLIQPLFHKKMIQSYAETMTSQTQSLADSWHSGQRIAVPKVMTELALTQCRLAYFDHAATWGFSRLTSLIVGGESWRVPWSPGLFTR
jgi:cytochrome P450